MLSRNICFLPSTQNLITFHKVHHHVMRPSPCPSKTNHTHITCCHTIRTLNSISHAAIIYVPWIPYHMLPQYTYLEFHITCCHKIRTLNSISHAATGYVPWISFYFDNIRIRESQAKFTKLYIYTTSTETKIPKNINKGRNRQGEIYGCKSTSNRT